MFVKNCSWFSKLKQRKLIHEHAENLACKRSWDGQQGSTGETSSSLQEAIMEVDKGDQHKHI